MQEFGSFWIKKPCLGWIDNCTAEGSGFGGYLFRAEATVNLPWFINDLDKKSSATCEQFSTIHN